MWMDVCLCESDFVCLVICVCVCASMCVCVWLSLGGFGACQTRPLWDMVMEGGAGFPCQFRHCITTQMNVIMKYNQERKEKD